MRTTFKVRSGSDYFIRRRKYVMISKWQPFGSAIYRKPQKTKWPKARFIRRTLHEPNLIIWFGACKDRRMNQSGSTDLYLGRPAVLFDCASRIGRQTFDFDSYVELFMRRTKYNAYVTYKLYKLYLSQRSARSVDLHAQRISF